MGARYDALDKKLDMLRNRARELERDILTLKELNRELSHSTKVLVRELNLTAERFNRLCEKEGVI